MKKFLILIFLVLFSVSLIYTDEEVKDEEVNPSSESEVVIDDDEDVLRILTQKGNVQLKNLDDRQIIIYDFARISYNKIIFEADKLTIEKFKDSDLTLIHGDKNVFVHDQETGFILEAGKIVYNSKRDFIYTTVNPIITVEEKDIRITSKEAFFYREQKLADAISDVDFIYNDYKGKGDRLQYYKADEKVFLKGSAKINRKDGSYMEGDEIKIYGRDTLIISGNGKVKLKDFSGLESKVGRKQKRTKELPHAVPVKDKSTRKDIGVDSDTEPELVIEGREDKDQEDKKQKKKSKEGTQKDKEKEKDKDKDKDKDKKKKLPKKKKKGSTPLIAEFEFMELRDKDNKIYFRYAKITQNKDWLSGDEIFIEYLPREKGKETSIKKIRAVGDAESYTAKDDSLVSAHTIELDGDNNISLSGSPRITIPDEQGKEMIISAIEISKVGDMGYLEGLVKIISDDYEIYAQSIQMNEKTKSGTATGSPYFVRDKDRLFGDEINFTPDTLEIIGNGFGWTYNKEEEKKKKPGDGKPSKIISEKDKKDKKVKSHDTSPSVSEDEKGTVVEKDKSPKVEPPTTEDIKESEEGKEKSKNVEPSKIEDLKESKKEKKGSHVIDQAPGKESGKDVKKELKKDLDPDDFVFFTFEYLFHDREKNVTRMKKFTMREGNIYIQADKIEMFGKLGKFKSGFGEGNIVVIDYSQNSMITGEAFRYDSDSGDVFLIGRSKIILGPEGPATKEPFIIQNDAWIEKHITSVPEDDLIEVEGYNLTFNRISKEASISNAVTYIKPWYIKSEKVLQVRKDIFWAEDSDITSCDEEIPHYYFRIKRLKIYTKDKMVARTMIGYFGRAPLLYFPYFIKDIDPVDSRWVVYLGQNQYEGYYWKNKYLIDMFKDRAHLALKFDYMSKLDWGRGFTYRYTSEKGKYRGFLNHYFNEDKITFTDLDGEEKNYYKLGYKWRGEHLHYLPLNSSLRIYIDRFSAPELNQNLYSDQVEEVAKRSEDTYVSLSNSYKAIYSLEILNQEKTNFYNDIETTYRKIPDVRLSFLSQKIPFVPVNYSLSTRYINYWNELYIQGGSTSFSLSTESFKLFRIISTNFQISESVYYVDKTMEENTNLWTRNFNGTTTISTKMWRIFNPEGVRKFKHTVSPRFSYNYTYVPENSRYIEREQYYFPDFMSVPVSGKSNRNIGLALNQNLQMKKETVITEEDKNILNNFMGKPQSEEMTKPEIRDIVSLEMSTNYNIDNRLWSDLNTLITSSFVKNFRLGLRITNDLDLWKLRSLSFNLSYNDQEHWDISSNLLYYPESAEFKTTMSNRVSWTMNDDFSIYFYSRYNFSGQSDFWHRLSSKEIGIEHSLHCWLLSVSWRQTYNLLADDQPETENMIWFKILLKAERSNKFSVENNFVTDQFSIMGNKTSSPF